MKKNESTHVDVKTCNVKEISDGVYINLSRITSDEGDFEKDIEETFKKLDQEERIHDSSDAQTKPHK